MLKSTPCWLTSAKLHHWGHTNVLAHCLIGKWSSNNAVSMQHYQISSDNSINIWFSDFSLSQYHIHGVHEEERRSPSPQCQSHEPHSTGNGCPQSTQTSNPRRRNRAMSMNLENFHVRFFFLQFLNCTNPWGIEQPQTDWLKDMV